MATSIKKVKLSTPQFDSADHFNEGLAEVRIGGKVGFIDKTGKYIWNPQN